MSAELASPGGTPEPAVPAPPRVTRAPTDVLRVGIAAFALAVTLVLGRLFDRLLVVVIADLLRGLDTLPGWLVTGLALAADVAVLVLVVGTVVAAALRRDGTLLASSLLSVAVALGLVLAMGRLVGGDVAVTGVPEPQPLFARDEIPSLASAAVAAAVVTACSPWTARRWRRAAWAGVMLIGTVVVLGNPTGIEPLLALEAGWLAGALAVVVLGAPSRRPTGEAIAAGLAAVGVPLARLDRLSVDARGSTPYRAVAETGPALFVKALGEDERSADLMFRLYRRLQPRDLGDEKPFSTLRRAVEHEALVALVARDAGARTPRLVAVASAEPNGYVLAYEAIAGRSLDRVADDEVTDDVLGQVWAQLRVLRERRIAHRDLRLANVFLGDDGQAWLIDFGFSELAAADPLLLTDVAELIASSTTRVGAERAVHAAVTAVGPAVVAAAQERLRLPFLSGATRTAMKSEPGRLDEVRTRIGAELGRGAPA